MDQDRQHGTVDNINDAAKDLREAWHRFGQARRIAALVSIWPIVAAIVVIFGIVFFILLGGGGTVGLGLGSNPDQQGSGIPPPNPAGNVLNYTIPLRDSTIYPVSKQDAIAKILAQFPKAQIQYWDTIVSQAVSKGWNPAFVLTLWIEETGASNNTKVSNGGGGTSPTSTGHLGCAPGEDQTINQSLNCLFKWFDQFDNDEFEAFMRRYSGEDATGPFVNNPNFPGNVLKFYNMLVPSGKGVAKSLGPSEIAPEGVGGARIASAGKQIAEQLVKSDTQEAAAMGCDKYGTYGVSYHCWREMKSYDQAGDPNYVQCTEYVWAAFDKAGFGKQIDLIRNNNAYYWPEVAQKNPETFAVFNDPNQLKPGDIISMGTGGGGGIVAHVAVVIERGYNTIKVGQASTQNPIETFYVENGKFVVHYPSNARC